ncbi:flagellar FliJ protein [Desulfovibrio legallii]|uniref:Flagellar FliJ protein n=2 Tax=Desulfovibrio legallii TaxID=571438 RepID=A0A1G7I1S1_9BACT|nr:flagellar FliJ protein [Desulfovibrio legallii]
MPFRFSMQKVLEYREQLEEEARVQLAQQELRLRRIREEQARCDAALRAAEARLCDPACMDTAERWLQEQYAKGLRADAANLDRQARMQETLTDEARRLLAARAVDKKLLEKLRQRQQRQYAREEYLKEQRVNDETATLRYKAPTL